MSRRPPNPGADRAAQNQQTLKTLVKVESNKSCADCKRNKHPRWASWNLGIFICIRCSGIHRGMGTHISRVKSVDLDAWTDEQLQSMIRWGNARANRYWESKLAPGHIPAEAKIENFIRTKYDTKRWVMEGGIPDPTTLDVEDGAEQQQRQQQQPLDVVREPPTSDRSGALRAPPPGSRTQIAKKQPQNMDLFREDSAIIDTNIPQANSSSTKPPPPPKADIPTQRQNKHAESLLGFDFFGSTQSAPPPRPSSAAASNLNTSHPSRPDLKQSILSLYASTPRTTSSMPVQVSTPVPSNSHSYASQFSPPPQASLGSLGDAFRSLDFTSDALSPTPKSTSFNIVPNAPQVLSQQAGAELQNARGNFFDQKSPTVAQLNPIAAQRQQGFSSPSGGFGEFSTTSPGRAPQLPQTRVGLESVAQAETAPMVIGSTTSVPSVATLSGTVPSPFNLSKSVSRQQGNSEVQHKTATSSLKPIGLDAWGSSDVWASSNPASLQPTAVSKSSSTRAVSRDAWVDSHDSNSSNNGRGFVTVTRPSQSTHVIQDEDFGGWESSALPASPVSQGKSSNAAGMKPEAGFGNGGEDLFSNVWE